MWMSFVAIAMMGSGVAGADTSLAPASPGALREIGRCMVKTDRGAAAALMQTLPAAQADTILSSLQLGQARACLAGAPSTASSAALRGWLAEALLLRDFPRFGVEPSVPRHMFADFKLPLESGSGVDQETQGLYKLAECVARNRGMDAETLFRSAPGSGVEARVLSSFAPIMVACRADSATIHVSRTRFRGVLAEAVYDVSVRYWTGKLWSSDK